MGTPTLPDGAGVYVRVLLVWCVVLLASACAAAASHSSAATTIASPTPNASPIPTERVITRQSSTPTPSATAPPASHAGAPMTIVFSRSGGFTGRTETFVLNPDGTITMSFTTAQVAGGAKAAARLSQNIVATKILELAPGEYLPKNACCDRYVYELTLKLNGKEFNYVALQDDDATPAPLHDTIELIEQYLTTAQ
ncbi:MAG: hypothetical protein LC737_01540 [Chloroflexi bacterium]|nr:hypothetical protein [Chloroflexota bacterium]